MLFSLLLNWNNHSFDSIQNNYQQLFKRVKSVSFYVISLRMSVFIEALAPQRFLLCAIYLLIEQSNNWIFTHPGDYWKKIITSIAWKFYWKIFYTQWNQLCRIACRIACLYNRWSNISTRNSHGQNNELPAIFES